MSSQDAVEDWRSGLGFSERFNFIMQMQVNISFCFEQVSNPSSRMPFYKRAHPELEPSQIQARVRQIEADVFKHASSEVHLPRTLTPDHAKKMGD